MRKTKPIAKFRKGYDDDKPLRKGQVRRVRRNAREVIRQQLADMYAEQAEFEDMMRQILADFADNMERMDIFMEDMLYPVGDEYTYQTDFDDEGEWL